MVKMALRIKSRCFESSSTTMAGLRAEVPLNSGSRMRDSEDMRLIFGASMMRNSIKHVCRVVAIGPNVENHHCLHFTQRCEVSTQC